ncbi:MAG: DUF1036 domain-containing protein, partial [Proteobacteria bacterium]
VYSNSDQEVCLSTEKDKVVNTSTNVTCNGQNQKIAGMKVAQVMPSKTNEFKFTSEDSQGKSVLKLCNPSDSTLRAAYAYFKDASEGFISKGWVNLSAGDCEEIKVAQEADLPYEGNVLIYGETEKLQSFGSGPLRFCVNSATSDWTIPQSDNADCKSRSLKRVDGTLLKIKAKETVEYTFGS